MRIIDQSLEVVRTTVRTVGSIEEDSVVAPVAASRKITDRHQFQRSDASFDDMIEVLRRKRTTLVAEAAALAESGMEAFRMVGMVRRKQERASAKSGEKFAFVNLSDPTGEYEVLFPPEALRKHRDVLEPGAHIAIKVRAKSADGDVRFFGDDAVYSPLPGTARVGDVDDPKRPGSPFQDMQRNLKSGDPFRHPKFPKVRPHA